MLNCYDLLSSAQLLADHPRLVPPRGFSADGPQTHAGDWAACLLAAARDQHSGQLILHPAKGKCVRFTACSWHIRRASAAVDVSNYVFAMTLLELARRAHAGSTQR